MLEIHQLKKIMSAMPVGREKPFNLGEIDVVLLAMWPEVELAASIDTPSLMPFDQWRARFSWAESHTIAEILSANDNLGAKLDTEELIRESSFLDPRDTKDDRLVKGVALYQFIKAAQASYLVNPNCLAIVSEIMVKNDYAAQYYKLKTGFVH
jgi:hypothetical protein